MRRPKSRVIEAVDWDGLDTLTPADTFGTRGAAFGSLRPLDSWNQCSAEEAAALVGVDLPILADHHTAAANRPILYLQERRSDSRILLEIHDTGVDQLARQSLRGRVPTNRVVFYLGETCSPRDFASPGESRRQGNTQELSADGGVGPWLVRRLADSMTAIIWHESDPVLMRIEATIQSTPSSALRLLIQSLENGSGQWGL